MSRFKQIATVNYRKQPLPYQDDPLRLYKQITNDKPHTMLLESAEIESKDHLKSFIITDAALSITCMGQTVSFSALTENGATLLPAIAQYFKPLANISESNRLLIVTFAKAVGELDEDARLKALSPLEGLRVLQQGIRMAGEDCFEGLFLGGVLGYDLIATVEPLQEVANSDNHCPDYLFYLAETLIVVDHQRQDAEIVTHAFSQDNKITKKLDQRVAEIIELCQQPSEVPPLRGVRTEVSANISDAEYGAQVEQLKEHIRAGDIFQVVPSRCFQLPCPNTLGAYRALRLTNPSPYMFYLRTADFTLFGASPESAVKYETHTNQVEMYPIAGTRKRGKDADGNIDADLDGRIELELRLDKKELAEHIMLVDLARNDIARISESGTRKVSDLLKVDRYSHVMHLVSRVTGQLRSDLDALHAYQACMNMGTLVGAPKVRAAQLVRSVEQKRRGSYGGAVGYINGLGDIDTCIVIRSAFVSEDTAYIQAGAGVVYDSEPLAEAEETRQKAQAVISAIKLGGGL
ncbi:anthranilate synthase component 1 [Shewanella yunxiaonensis]|uniref:Anthranilate synthase component 1 n=1 Tax=Shewanella yunxiaonensis TaxID=2829809 RepID=A0ABX7YWL7_9GAMM|nr:MULTISPECIES: anthranilate synthase component 1 [Shewanella]MDF0535103.1 anthranilate synthase component 1 [Shewanella sp. A32]QUN07164.1 anthranilate synthase component 1 [Shewanella yunxiaonensis]